MTARQKLLAKIKSLLQMTVANGCTEAEAMSALGLAHKLMTDHEVTDTDLTFGGEACKVNTEPKDDRDEIRANLCLAVGAFCGCRGFKNGIERIAYVGLYSDTVFAHWLLDTLEQYVKRELENYLDANPRRQRVRRLETRGFVIACTNRLVERLYELAAQRAKGTALALKKQEIIVATMAATGLRLKDGPFRLGRRADTNAVAAGEEAGDRATFDKAVNAGDTPKAIGGNDHAGPH